MQLCISVTGTIDNFMDVHNFPYDEDSVDITLCGCFLRDGRPADATDFVLIPSDPRIVDTGYPFLALCFLTDLPAYEILGYNFKAYTKSKRHKKNAAYTRTWSYLNWGISIRRKSSWYFWKVNLLLYLIAVFSLATFVFSPEDFDARTQHTSTLFLASAATLYVVGEKLPPISFLTKCDKLIVATLGLIFLAQVECCIVKFMVDDGQIEEAKSLDFYAFIVLAVLYTAYSTCLFFPPLYAVWMAGGKPLQCVEADEIFVPYADIPKIDFSDSAEVLVGYSQMEDSAKLQMSKMYDTDGDGVADKIDFDNDGIMDADLQQIKH